MAHSKVAPTYAYIFRYKGKYNVANFMGIDADDWGEYSIFISFSIVRATCGAFLLGLMNCVKTHLNYFPTGVGHGEDAFYVFNSSTLYHGFQQVDCERKLSELMVNFLSNFAKNL